MDSDFSLPLSFLLSGVCWCMGGVCRNAFARSMVGSAVCQGRWVYAAVAAASHPQGRFLPPLLSSPVPLRRSDSSPGSLEGAPPAWVPPESVPVSRILTALHRNATRAGNIGCLGTLKAWRPKVYQISPNSIDTFSLDNGRRMETFPGSHFEKAAVQ